MKIFLNHDERLRYVGFDDRWAILVGVPLLSAISVPLFTANQEPTVARLMTCLLIGALYSGVYWAATRTLVISLRRRLPRQDQTTRRLLYTLLGSVAIVTTFELLMETVLTGLFPGLRQAGYDTSPVLFKIIVSLTLSLLVVAIYESIYFFTKYRSSLLEQERLSRANMQAQLTSLKEQVNPHFLFNSLNTLVNLIPEDGEKAVDFTQRLSAVYRRILEYRHHELIDLQEELSALRDYVFLMQTRFEDKLIVEWDTAAGSQVQYRIVPLSLQLLVENALKHNVVSQERPLTVRIAVAAGQITVANTLHLRPRPLHSTGWGQESIRRRYRMITPRPVHMARRDDWYVVSLPLIAESEATRYATA